MPVQQSRGIGKENGRGPYHSSGSSLYRILMCADHDRVFAHSQANIYHGDNARRGQSASYSAETRAFEAEVAILSGGRTRQAIWDIGELCASTDIVILFKLARRYGFPLWELSLTVLIHQAPRRLLLRQAVGLPVIGLWRSILAAWLSRSQRC